MSGYAASARIVRASPHLVERRRIAGPSAGSFADGRPAGLDTVAIESPGAVIAEPVFGVAEGSDSVAERWARFRDRWHQLTFYLTDPQSWR